LSLARDIYQLAESLDKQIHPISGKLFLRERVLGAEPILEILDGLSDVAERNAVRAPERVEHMNLDEIYKG
jgi:hypothetical protein